MSRFAHKTRTNRKLVTVQEWADYIGVSKNTMLARLKAYKTAHDYEPRDSYSVFDFLLWLADKELKRRQSQE